MLFVQLGLKKFYDEWVEDGRVDESRYNFFGSCHAPMDLLPSKGLIVDEIPIPELHIFLGIFNKIYFEMEKVWEESQYWPKKLYVVYEKYHNKMFEGNECRKLLNNIDVLESLIPRQSQRNLKCIHPGKKFVKAFRSFKDVKEACFQKKLNSSFPDAIEIFKKDYLDLEISVTSKCHILFDHVITVCQKNQLGLGFWSEQSLEALHADFSKFEERHKCKDINNPNYGPRLLQSVLEYNSAHI